MAGWLQQSQLKLSSRKTEVLYLSHGAWDQELAPNCQWRTVGTSTKTEEPRGDDDSYVATVARSGFYQLQLVGQYFPISSLRLSHSVPCNGHFSDPKFKKQISNDSILCFFLIMVNVFISSSFGISRLREIKMKFQLDLMVQFLFKQGQVELDGSNLIPDYTDAILINRSIIEELNSTIRVSVVFF